MASIIQFRDPSLPLEGAERLAARRQVPWGCKAIAATAVAQAMSESFKIPGVGKLGADDALPVFVAAMRRELCKSGLF